MSYAFVQDVAASWDQYERVAAALLEPAPAGLVLHLAGPTDEGFRTIEIWENEQAWEHFQAKRLAPAIAALGGPARPEPTSRGLRAAHVVVGTAIAEKRLPEQVPQWGNSTFEPGRAERTRHTIKGEGRNEEGT